MELSLLPRLQQRQRRRQQLPMDLQRPVLLHTMVKVVDADVTDLWVPLDLHLLADQQPFLRQRQTAAGCQHLLAGAESAGAMDGDCTIDADVPRAGGAMGAAENVGSVAVEIQVSARLSAAGSRRPWAGLCPLVVRAAAGGQISQGSSRVGRQLGVAGSG